MEYNTSKIKFDAYVEECRQEIIRQFFPNEAHLLNHSELITNNNYDLSLTKEENERRKALNSRLAMIKQKLNHTMRMVDEIIRINDEMGIKLDFQLVMKLAILYHDIGRFEQATWAEDFSDRNYKDKVYNGKEVHDHGEAGKEIFLTNDFAVDEQYSPIIGESIFYHQNTDKSPKLNYQYDSLSEVRGLNINEIATGHNAELLNEAEWHLVAIITQLVADIDKVDIFFQYLTKEEPIMKDFAIDRSRRNLDKIALDWGISKQEILEYNNITENSYNTEPVVLYIPIKNLETSKLAVSEEFKDIFYKYCETDDKEIKETFGNLGILWKRIPKWSSIYVLWWRIGRFIKDINFYSILTGIEESKLLKDVYTLMPDEYKPLIIEPIEYAINTLIPHKKGKEPSLYARR